MEVATLRVRGVEELLSCRPVGCRGEGKGKRKRG